MKFNPDVPVWQRLILQVGHAPNFLARRPLLDWFKEFGVTGIIVKGSHGVEQDETNRPALLDGEFKAWSDRYPFSVWHFADSALPEMQAKCHVQTTRRYGVPIRGNRWTIINAEYAFNAIPGQSLRYVMKFRELALTMQGAIQPEGAHFLHESFGPLPVHADYAPFVRAGFRSIPQAYYGTMRPVEPWKVWFGQVRKDGYGAGFPSSYVRWTTPTAGSHPERPPASWYRDQMLDLKERAEQHLLSFPRGIVVYLGETVTDEELAAISEAGFTLGMLRA